MPSQPSEGSRHVRTEDLLPPPPMAKALMFGLAAAIAGAVAWALLLIFAGWEHGLLAWGIGALIGFAVVQGGGHGTVLAVCAGVLALASIGTGKHLSYKNALDEYIETQAPEAAYDSLQRRAEDWQALGAEPPEEEVLAFAGKYGDEPEDLEGYVSAIREYLRPFIEEKPTLDQWRDEIAEGIKSENTFVDYLRRDFHILDIVFAILGIATAFGLVSKATMQLQIVARENIRAEREAEEAAAAAEAAPDEK